MNLVTGNANDAHMRNLLSQFIVIAVAGVITSGLIEPLWVKDLNLCHTVLELICVFASVSMFLVVWLTYERNIPVNRIIGFGFLAVSVFYIFHIYFHNRLDIAYYDLSTRYWILVRLTEAIILLMCTKKQLRLKINKWEGGLFSIVSAVGISFIIMNFPELIPSLLTEQGITPLKIFMEYVIIALFLVGLYNLRNKLYNRDVITYRYIFLALLISIPAESWFALYNVRSSFFLTMGHVLKLAAYYFLFKGIFVSAITYPYDRLEQAGRDMTNILNGLPLGMATFDKNQQLAFANQRAEEILGCTAETLQGLSITEISAKFEMEPPLKQPHQADLVAESILTIKQWGGNSIKLRNEIQFLDNGGLMCLFDEAKKAQELENLKIQTQTILNSINNLVLIIDKRQKIVMCNNAFEEITGLSAADVLGKSTDEVVQALSLTKNLLPPDKQPEDFIQHFYEAVIIKPSGNRKELLLHCSNIRNVDKEIIGTIAIAYDVTQMKKEQQTRQNQEKLVVLGQMAAGIVHEIRNPLTTIKGFNQLIAATANDTTVKDYANVVLNAVSDINKVVTDFLAFAKPHPPVLLSISINELIHSLKLMLETNLFLKGVNITIVPSAVEKEVMADESQIKQVILNIVKNAIDAMNEVEQPQLTIKTGFDQINEEMFIAITDNGRGISPEDKKIVGTPFFTTKEKGTGLGLSICFQIIKEHSGRIEIESELGQGTTFVIYIPCQGNVKSHVQGSLLAV